MGLKDFDKKEEVVEKENKVKGLSKARTFYDGMDCSIKTVYKKGTLENEIKPQHRGLINPGEFNK